jgi:hypothetical protein
MRELERLRYGALKIEGNAHLKVSLNGFPKGTRTSSQADGVFKDVSLDRGASMPWASQEG